LGADPFFGLVREGFPQLGAVFGSDGGFLPRSATPTPITLWEDDDRYYVEVDVPGVSESDVNVTVHDRLLQIRAERKSDPERKYLFNGRHFGTFERVVKLPDKVAGAEVKASLSNGVLRIELTKSSESKPRRIAIQTA
jgi:HSP20 family protein